MNNQYFKTIFLTKIVKKSINYINYRINRKDKIINSKYYTT